MNNASKGVIQKYSNFDRWLLGALIISVIPIVSAQNLEI